MSEAIIKVENISKKYNLVHKEGGTSDSVIESVSKWSRSLFTKKQKTNNTEEFWALQGINLEIQRGDRVGIIGRNGAGKSTLLKILSRIVIPTTGRIEYEGRMASLLEVGTGFHGDLSGRENIYLNGSILGMSKKEIDNKFDEIVAFSEVERFLDTPVKRYSSGMYVRLAFAVAAHLEPEILIVDEVLAVGDAEFQKKCLGKMREVSNSGRTILFVSHNMAAIQNLCNKCIYLKNGTLIEQGETSEVIHSYLRSSTASNQIDLSQRKDRSGNRAVLFHSFKLKDKNDNLIATAQSGTYVKIEIEFKHSKSSLSNFKIAIGIDDEYGQRITQLNNEVTDQAFEKISGNNSIVCIEIPHLPLKQGDYTLALFATINGEIADWIQEAVVLQVEAGDFFNTGKLPENSQGNFYINHSFSLK
jgi:lipopolysaccharide transport system ATP-binding protein